MQPEVKDARDLEEVRKEYQRRQLQVMKRGEVLRASIERDGVVPR
jgi:hypothetical protein